MTVHTGAEVFRDYVTDGVPASGTHKVEKAQARALFTLYESLLNGSAAGLAYATLAAINADLAHAASTLAIVYGDSTAANNGTYVKAGGSGVGSWSRIGDLPNAVIRLTVTGGTGDAIVATAPETPTVPANKIYLLTPGATNSGATTIAVNGEAAVAIKNNFGSTLVANSLVVGAPVAMIWSMDHYRLLVSLAVDTAGVVADAVAARDDAEDARDAAIAAVPDSLTISTIAASIVPAPVLALRPVGFSVVDPLASTWKRVSAPGVTMPWHKQSSDGQWWEIADHIAHPFMFGNVGKGADDSQAFQDCTSFIARASASLTSTQIYIPAGIYEIDNWSITGITAQLRHFKISGHGAKLKPRAGGSALGRLMSLSGLGPGVGALLDIEGIYFDQAAATSHLNALVLSASGDTTIRRCYFAGGGSASLRPIQLKQSNVSDINTANFWVTVDNCWIRQNGASVIDFGLISDGANNHLIVNNTKISGCTTAALVQTNGGGGTAYAANSVQFLRNAIEGNTYGVHYATPPSQHPFGFRGIGNRFESTNYPWRFTLDSGSLVTNGAPPLLQENIYQGELAAVTNTSGAIIHFLDQRNRSGAATIANGNTGVSVAFPVTEFSANYNVVVRGGDASLYVTNVGTGGFDIIRSGSSGALPVSWTVVPGTF